MGAFPLYTRAYDELNRLPTACLTGAGAGVNFNSTYTYNRLCNIMSRMGTDPDMTYTYGAANARLQSVTRIA